MIVFGARQGSRFVDTRLTASIVDIEVTFLSNSSSSVGVQAQGECRFERVVIDTEAGMLNERGALILPNPNKEKPLLLN